jgi:hypothetical protein
MERRNQRDDEEERYEKEGRPFAQNDFHAFDYTGGKLRSQDTSGAAALK